MPSRKKKRLKALRIALISLMLSICLMLASYFGYVALTQFTYNTTNEEEIYLYLHKTMNLNAAASSGILGNIYYESKFEPDTHGDNNTSYGICQWHKTRRTRLKEYCKEHHLDYQTINGQMQFLEYELTHHYRKTYAKIQAVPDNQKGAMRAAEYWCRGFEKPSNVDDAVKLRQKKAKSYYKKYQKKS